MHVHVHVCDPTQTVLYMYMYVQVGVGVMEQWRGGEESRFCCVLNSSNQVLFQWCFVR